MSWHVRDERSSPTCGSCSSAVWCVLCCFVWLVCVGKCVRPGSITHLCHFGKKKHKNLTTVTASSFFRFIVFHSSLFTLKRNPPPLLSCSHLLCCSQLSADRFQLLVTFSKQARGEIILLLHMFLFTENLYVGSENAKENNGCAQDYNRFHQVSKDNNWYDMK